MPSYRLLCFDGGGIRGAFSATLLRRLCDQVPTLLDKADLVAGTSTGGIIALGVCAEIPPREIQDLYQRHGREVFDDSWLDDVKDLGKLSGADYSSKGLANILTRLFGNKTLAQLNKKVLVPAFDLDAPAKGARPRMWKPKFFHNFPGPDSDGSEKVVDVALRTAAAPTYFPSYQGYVDGGVVTNNPSVAALAQALHPTTGRQQLRNIRLLSIGTGLNPMFIEGQKLDWGLAQWAKPLATLMIEGVMGVTDYQCTQLLGDRYFRLNPVLEQPVQLDDVEKVNYLVNRAQRLDLTPCIDWIKKYFSR